MEIYNASTSLTADILVMGETTKRSAGSYAGFFGEGVKVEINRLKYVGADVAYYTNDTKWDFFYNANVLQADITHHLSYANGTLIAIKNAPASAYNPADFLFLLPCSQVISSKPDFEDQNNLTGLDILLCNNTHRRVYVQGIFVTNIKLECVEFGLNYTGPCLMDKLNMGRDRNSMSLSALIALIPDVFMANRQEEVLIPLCQVIYNAINASEREFTYFKISLSCHSQTNLTCMVEDLLNYFFFLFKDQPNYPNFMPTNNITSELTKELELFGYNPIHVEKNLFEFLLKSPQCPTVAKLWERNYKTVLRLPEFVFDHVQPSYEFPVDILHFPTQQLVDYATSIRLRVSQYFDDSAMGDKVRFKFFAVIKNKKNVRRFVPIKIPPSDHVSLFIFDIGLLDARLVHEESRRSNSDFVCEGNCGCVLNAIIEDILGCLGSHLRQKYDYNFRRKYLNSLQSNLPCSPSHPPPPTSPPSRPPPPPPSVPSSSMHAVPPAVAAVDQSGIKSPADAQGTLQKAKHVVYDDLTKRRQAPVRGALTDVGENQRGIAERCCTSHSAGRLSSEVYCAPTRPPPTKKPTLTYCYGTPGKTYRRVNGRFLFDMAVFVDSDEMLSVLARSKPALLALQLIIMYLNTFVFGYPLQRLCIVLEDTAVIAFNRGGDIFFNLLAMIPLDSQGPQYAIDMWFSTFCHELAHNNGQRAHDDKFAYAFGSVVSYKLPVFRQACAQLFQDARCLSDWSVFLRCLEHCVTRPEGQR
eukprot:gene35053-42453_t